MDTWIARRPPIRIALALISACLVLGLAGSADALKICARKTKKGALKGLTLGEPDCPRHRPEVVLDLTGQLGGLTGRLDDVGGRLDGLGSRMDVVQLTTLGAECDGAPTRTLAASGDFLDVQSIEEMSQEGCHAFDGNQAACDGAFELADTGAAACFYLNGRCHACDFQEHSAGACLNACNPDQPKACALRPRFAGDDCSEIEDAATCNLSWIDGGGRYPLACRWQEIPTQPPTGFCQTSSDRSLCGAQSTPPSCPGRSVIQDPATLTYLDCSVRTTADECNGSAQLDVNDVDQDGSADDAVPCFFHIRPGQTNGSCNACTYEQELRGRCTNTCG